MQDDDSIDSFLRRVAATGPPPRFSSVPRVVGRYEVRGVLGSGGLGLVRDGWDPRLGREVAIKFVRPDRTAGEAGSRMQLRLRREAQALARLAHEHVVPVFDVGEADGQVWIVMKKIAGPTLRQWLARSRSVSEVLEIFTQAGSALAAAHDIGVVHRDFKPENVLVEDGRAIVVDFGLAAASAEDSSLSAALGSQPRATDSSLTESGTVLGTRAYAAPEQIDGEAATTQSDQYSFCVALREALDASRSDARHERVDRRIDRVLARGLEIRPAQRWPSMHALLDALRRAPETRSWRSWAAGVTVAACSVATFVATRESPCSPPADGWGEDIRARLADAATASGAADPRALANRLAEATNARVDEWTNAWQQACPEDEPPPATWPRARACLDEARAELTTMVDTIADSPDPVVLYAAPIEIATLSLLPRCQDERWLGRDDEWDPAERNLWRELWDAHALRLVGRNDDALALATTVLRNAQTSARRSLRAAALLELAELSARRGDVEEAERQFDAAYVLANEAADDRAALTAATRLTALMAQAGDRPTTDALRWGRAAQTIIDRSGAAGRVEEAVLLESLGWAQFYAGKPPEAERSYRRAVAILEASFGADDPNIATIRAQLGHAYRAQGRHDEALAEQRRAYEILRDTLGPGFQDTIAAQASLALAHYERRELATAESLYRDALSHAEATFGAGHPVVFQLQGALGLTLTSSGRAEEGLVLQEAALQGLQKVAGPEHLEVARLLNQIQATYRALGQLDDAASALTQAELIFVQSLGPEHPDVRRNQRYKATLDVENGRPERGRDALEELVRTHAKLDGPPSDLAFTLVELGHAHLALGADRAAVEAYTQAVEVFTTVSPAELSRPFTGRSNAYRRLGKLDEAIADAERAIQSAESFKVSSKLLGDARFALARALTEADQAPGRVVDLAAGARAAYVDAGAAGSEMLAELEAWSTSLEERPP